MPRLKLVRIARLCQCGFSAFGAAEIAELQGQPPAVIDTEVVPEYDKENGQEVWENGLKETDQDILRRRYPEGDSGGRSEDTGTIRKDDSVLPGEGTSEGESIPEELTIGKSLSAKAKNYDVMDLQTGEQYRFVEGTRIQNVEVFAGKGTKVEFRDAQKYADRYGGRPEDWQHVKGFGLLATEDGDMEAEVHWVQSPEVGKFEFFVKEWIEE